jgi:hypothetical protein
MRFLILAACLGLCACAGMMPPAPIYYRQNATNEELQRDLAGCRVQMAMTPQQTVPQTSDGPDAIGSAVAANGTEMQNSADREYVFANCMRAKGWVRQN